ncbi:hypothetical protein ACHAXA_004033 [Cyclostephanos tholiformis]|jgi:hypothetical protein|uniref:CENP-V/GFA domain-containing protein n=1 Tax=Cyclostephanos tholiformis TaxID=382380 RepID=A0ABD3RA94_9STRA
MLSTLHLKCKCGSFEATFDAPPRLTFNCHCHSCVAVIQGIEAKDGFSGTSMKSDKEGGAAICIFKSNNVTVTKVDSAKIGFMKVGEGGKIPRPYCTECGTVLYNVWKPTWCAANRNALFIDDGSPFVPTCTPVMNIMSKNAFDQDKVPEPKHKSAPLGMFVKFIPLVVGLVGDGSNSKVNALIPVDISKVESVPITWE